MNGMNGMRIVDKSEPAVIVSETIVLAGLALEGLPLKVWLVLKRYSAHKGTQLVSNISLRKIAEKVDRSVTQVSKAVATLEEIRLVHITQKERKAGGGVYNVYELENPKTWWERHGQRQRATAKRRKKQKWQGADERLRQRRERQESQMTIF